MCFLGGNPFGGGSPFGQSVDAEEILRSFFEGRDSPFGGFQTRSGGFSEYEQVQVWILKTFICLFDGLNIFDVDVLSRDLFLSSLHQVIEPSKYCEMFINIKYTVL